MNNWLTGAVIMIATLNLAGCLDIPQVKLTPSRTLTYKLDRNKGEWTQSDCVISHNENAHQTEMVCQEQIIVEPPAGFENRLRQRDRQP
jgi:hypothetical protein